MQGDLGAPPMSTFGVRSPGHEGAGVVVKVGANVKNFKLGDRAGIKPLTDTCGSCYLCWDDKETYCKTAIHTGLMTAGEYEDRIKFSDLSEILHLDKAHTSNTWFLPHDMHRRSPMVFPMKSPHRLCAAQARFTGRFWSPI